MNRQRHKKNTQIAPGFSNFLYLHPPKPVMRKFYFIFFVVNLLLSFWFVDTWNNGNTTSRALPVVTFFEQGTLGIDKYHELTPDKAHINGKYYTDKAPLPTLVAIPFYGLIKKLGWVNEGNDHKPGPEIYILGSFLFSSLIFAFILLLTLRRIIDKNPSVSSIALVMLPFYGSMIFVYSGTFYAHLFASFLILMAYLCIGKKQFFLAGLFSGLAFLSEYTIALFFPVWAMQIWIQEKSFYKGFRFGLGTVPAIVFIGIYNFIFTGSPFEMLYKYHTFAFLHENYGFTVPSFSSLWGLTFSNYKGLFFYVPFLALSLFVIFKHASFKKISQHYLTWISMIFFLFIASYIAWWGGWCYGPRLLFPVAVLLVHEGIVQLAGRRFSKTVFLTLTFFGLAGAFLAKITIVYSIPSESQNPFIDTIFPNIIQQNFNPNNLGTMIFGIQPLVSGILWLMLFIASVAILGKMYRKNIISGR